MTKYIAMIVVNLVRPKTAAKQELLFNKLASGLRGQFVEQKLMLSSSFRRDQIYKDERYDFGHTLLCYLSRTFMFNKSTSVYTTVVCLSYKGKSFIGLTPRL